MATRRQVREAFYDELETAAGALVPVDNISQEDPNDTEDLPAIVHNDAYRTVPMHNMSAPTDVEREGGIVRSITFSRPMQARFTLTIQSDDEQEKEMIYEQVRSHFEDYSYSASYFPDPSQIQEDIHDIDVEDSNSNDLTDRDPPARSDVVLVLVGYERTKYGVRTDLATGDEDFAFDTIEDIEHEIDVDADDIAENTYTTT